MSCLSASSSKLSATVGTQTEPYYQVLPSFDELWSSRFYGDLPRPEHSRFIVPAIAMRPPESLRASINKARAIYDTAFFTQRQQREQYDSIIDAIDKSILEGLDVGIIYDELPDVVTMDGMYYSTVGNDEKKYDLMFVKDPIEVKIEPIDDEDDDDDPIIVSERITQNVDIKDAISRVQRLV